MIKIAFVTYLKIKCFNCGETFDISRTEVPNPIKCPVCQNEMDDESRNNVFKALNATADANYHFDKWHHEFKEPLFQISSSWKEI